MPENLLITGASGFIGTALVNRAIQKDYRVRAASRQLVTWPKDVESIQLHDLATMDWRLALRDIHTVVHLAARAHVPPNLSACALTELRRLHVVGTLNLARQAADAGVRRFVFMSSVKVHGESTLPAQPYTIDDIPLPIDPYGVTKYEAELNLKALADQSKLELVVIRPVLTYGPGVKGNFFTMMSWIYRGIPLPLGSINNRRSLVALDNLVDLVLTCLQHPAAANRTFLVSDDHDLSTTELITMLASAMGRPARLFSVPPVLLRLGSMIFGKHAVSRRLVDSLHVDITNTRRVLGWVPPTSIGEGLQRTVEHFLRN